MNAPLFRSWFDKDLRHFLKMLAVRGDGIGGEAKKLLQRMGER